VFIELPYWEIAGIIGIGNFGGSSVLVVDYLRTSGSAILPRRVLLRFRSRNA
jgi:hypothetical protein